LKEEGNSLGKIRNIMLIKYVISVITHEMRKIIQKFQKTRNYEDQKRVSRPPKFCLHSKRIRRRICLKNMRLSLTTIAGLYNTMSQDRMSKSTVYKILVKYGLCSHRTANKLFMTDRQRKKRVDKRRFVLSGFQCRMHVSYA